MNALAFVPQVSNTAVDDVRRDLEDKEDADYEEEA